MFLERLQSRPLALIWRSDDPGPQCAGSAASRPAGFRGGSAPADTAVRPGSSGPQAGPGERQGPGQLPMAPWSLAARLAQFCLPERVWGRGVSPQGMPRASGPSDRRRAAVVEGGRARRAAADDQERAPELRCAAPRRPCPPLPSPPSPPSPPLRTRAPGPILGNPKPPSLVPWLLLPELVTHLVSQTEPASPSPKLTLPRCAARKRDCVFVGTCTYVPMDARAYGTVCRLQTYVCERGALHMYACTTTA